MNSKDKFRRNESRESSSDTSKDEIALVGLRCLRARILLLHNNALSDAGMTAKEDNLLEIAALHGWHRAKALYLEGGLRGNQGSYGTSISNA